MVGQGSPLGDRGANFVRTGCCVMLALVLSSAMTPASVAQNVRRASATAAAEPLELRLRVKWGFAKPRAWRGIVEVTQGEVLSMRHLGPSADGAASYRLRDGRVDIDELTPRTQSEIEIVVQAPRDAELVVHLEENAESALQRRTSIPLTTLICKPAQLEATEEAPWLSAARSPGDSLRIVFENERRIFTAGDTAVVSVSPHEILADPSNVTLPLQLRAELRLVSLKTQQDVWYERREIESDTAGNLPALPPIEILLPRDEGAYEFVVRLENRRFLSSGFAPIEQKQSLVVLAEQGPAKSEVAWRSVLQVDPTVRSWWDSLRVLPSIKGIPGLSATATPVASAKTGVVSRGGRKWAALPGGAWQAIPLPTQVIGEPHIVQIELPCDEATTPKILLLEQRAGGQVVNVGLDAGGILPKGLSIDRTAGEKAETRVHSLVYWPTTPNAWLVVMSRTDIAEGETCFGSLEHFAGPAQLPAASATNRSDRGRIFSLDLRSDRWREQMGADSSSPAGTAEANYQASLRLASYLKAKGYNSSRLLVASSGKSLYPSEYFDSPTAPSAEIDLIELLLRVMARERLYLIAEFAFNAPLGQLETLRNSADEVVPGTDMIMKGGAAVRLAGLSPLGTGPLYNPLDSEVQSAMRAPLEDFLDRYALHESFGGIAMRLSPDCYSRLPSEEWGKDSPTMDKFAAKLERLKLEPKSRPNQRANFVQPDKRDAWLNWRARELCGFYDWLQRRVTDARPEARLYLPLGGLLEGPAAEQKIRDSIFGVSGASMRDLWLSAGIELTSWKELQEAVFLRPVHLEIPSIAATKLYVAAENSNEWRQFAEGFYRSGAAVEAEEVDVVLVGFAQRGPFRGLTSDEFKTQPLRPHSQINPLVEGLSASDPFAFSVDLTPSPNQADQPGADWVDIFRRLPPVMMDSVTPRGSEDNAMPSTPVVIRQKTIASRTWFYVVNPCPFPVTITVDFQAPPNVKIESLGAKKLPAMQPIGKVLSWSYTLAPREIVGGAINSPKSKLLSYSTSVDREIRVRLSNELAAIRLRLLQANKSSNRSFDVLSNPDFEGPASGDLGADFGWEVTHGDPLLVSVVPDKSGGEGTCVRMTSRGGIVSLRSQVIPYPQSQRLQFAIDLRTDSSGERSPEVKLVIEGELDGRPFVRRATVNKAKTIDPSWRNIRFEVDYLPVVTNLRVGVDLCSSGAIYVDRASLSDFWYSKVESQPVLKELAVAIHELEGGRVTSAQRLLDGYLPNYLREQVDQLGTRNPMHLAMPPEKPSATPNSGDRSLQDRVKEMLPIPKSLIQRR